MRGMAKSIPIRKIKNHAGKRFGRLLVIEFCGYKGGRTEWSCQCDCGKIKKATANNLLMGNVKSCGCLKDEKFPMINRRHGFAFRSGKHPIYKRWLAMKDRCRPENPHSKTYFERGISVCDRWNKFENFLIDMGRGFKSHLSLHRKNNNLGYFKNNCKWAGSREQSRQRTDNRFITINGTTKILNDWLSHYKISSGCFYGRIAKGMSESDAITSRYSK